MVGRPAHAYSNNATVLLGEVKVLSMYPAGTGNHQRRPC